VGSTKRSRDSSLQSARSASHGVLALASSSSSAVDRVSIQSLRAAIAGPYQALGPSMRAGSPAG